MQRFSSSCGGVYSFGALRVCLCPETNGLSLEQADRMMEEVSPRNNAKWVPQSTYTEDLGMEKFLMVRINSMSKSGVSFEGVQVRRISTTVYEDTYRSYIFQ